MASSFIRNRAASVMAAVKSGRGIIKNRVSIDERPEIVDQKSRMGDWEGDTVIGKNHRGGLVTLAKYFSSPFLASLTQS
jgi:transposase, IS30 family